jgi:hypothetical protein
LSKEDPVDLYDPDHHLERRPEGFWLSITVHGDGRPRRIRKPLDTHDRETARQRRDRFLRTLPDAEALVSHRTDLPSHSHAR